MNLEFKSFENMISRNRIICSVENEFIELSSKAGNNINYNIKLIYRFCNYLSPGKR